MVSAMISGINIITIRLIFDQVFPSNQISVSLCSNQFLISLPNIGYHHPHGFGNFFRVTLSTLAMGAIISGINIITTRLIFDQVFPSNQISVLL